MVRLPLGLIEDKFYLVAIFATAKAVECIGVAVNFHTWFIISMERAFKHVVTVGFKVVMI
jgi:hypothetical protein